ncbi:MAG: hypothetical protein K6F86_03870 [Lachnospiraceae bacterium]|nr:hypothetical protein [Lachnospiraceae bacterium]
MKKVLQRSTAAGKLENINISIPASYTVYFNVSDNDLKEGNVSMNYTLAALPEADLVIGQSVEVGFYSAKTGKSISDNMLVAADKLNGIRITVSSATAPKEFKYFDAYFDNSDNKSTTLLKENGGFTDTFVPGEGWVYTFNLADAYEKSEGKASIKLYGSDTEYIDEFSGKAKIISTGGVTVSVASIKPVVYDGYEIYAENDPKAYYKDGSVKKNISPKLNVKIVNFDSGAVLVPGTDYSLSYKNNVNAVTSKTTDKKSPMVVITGKGNYKGIKVTVPFMILPADMSEFAKIKAGGSKYVKYGKRGFDAKLTVVAGRTKKKLNKKTYDLIYYTADGKVTDASNYTKDLTYATEFLVTARAKDDQNYTGETVFDEDGHVWGVPGSSKKLKVKGTNKGDFAENKKYEEFFKEDSITAQDKSKTVIPVGDRSKAGVWYEDTAGEKVKGQKIIEGAGTHYLYVGPDYDNVENLEPEQLILPKMPMSLAYPGLPEIRWCRRP